MAGTTHPFFGNQYTDGGYKIGSFKFPEGLTREVTNRTPKIPIPNPAPVNPPSARQISPSAPVNAILKGKIKGKWVIPTLIALPIAALGGYLTYRYFKNKKIAKVPNVGVCECCAKPLTGATFVPDADIPYIVCKHCGEKNYAKYPDKDESASTETEQNQKIKEEN